MKVRVWYHLAGQDRSRVTWTSDECRAHSKIRLRCTTQDSLQVCNRGNKAVLIVCHADCTLSYSARQPLASLSLTLTPAIHMHAATAPSHTNIVYTLQPFEHMYLPYPEFWNLVESGLNLGASHTFQYDIPASTKFCVLVQVAGKITHTHTDSHQQLLPLCLSFGDAPQLPSACVLLIRNVRPYSELTIITQHCLIRPAILCMPASLITATTPGSHFTVTTNVHVAQRCNIKFLSCLRIPPS
jgi:hypothetical protein